MQIIDGKRPLRPTYSKGCVVEPSDMEWDLVERCWNAEHASRPTMTDVCATLEGGKSGKFLCGDDSSLTIPMEMIAT
jgi:hypothetical protein